MKKYLLLLLIISLCAVSCIRQPQKGKDLVIVNKGKISFYDVQSQELTPFEAEADSVVNMLFVDRDHLYYSTANNQKLSLKMLDLSESKPAPKFCADWNLTVEEAMDYTFSRVTDIYLDDKGNNIVIFGMDVEDGMFCPFAYDLKSGKTSKLGEDESSGMNIVDNLVDADHFFTSEHLLYYVTAEGKTCLNDKIDFSLYFTEEDELCDLEFAPISSSPDGKKFVYSAVVYWGEGWGFYCVSDADGSAQHVMEDSDVWHGRPGWLADGSLAYVGQAPLPESDPDYDEDYNTTQPCIKLIDPLGNNTKTISLGDGFAVRPFVSQDALQPQEKQKQGYLEGCDVAIFDNGKVTFYNSTTDVFVPFVAENDSVINGVFVDDYSFYYTVKIGEELYLKVIYMSDYETAPMMLADWGLRLADCVSETYGKASTLVWLSYFERIGISHEFSWDFYNFSEIRFYDYSTGKMLNGWSEEENVESDIFDDSFMQYENDLEQFATHENNYYYLADEQPVCLSDKIDFEAYCSDPDYCSDPEFEFYSIDPTRKSVAYVAFIEWGDLGHGPLCMASLDGTMQLAFKGTDAANLSWGWLGNGSLLYIGEEPRLADDPEYDPEWNTTKPCIRIVHPDGTEEVFSHSTDFVVRGR